MNIYPAIDLKSGECVRLYKGSFTDVTVYEKDPVQVAIDYAEQGATDLHIIDLDGAKEGNPANVELIARILQVTRLQVQVGGGIRTKAQIEAYFNQGVSRVIVGSMAITDPSTVKSWLNEYGDDKIVLALDVRMDEKKQPLVATHGWQVNSTTALWDILDLYLDVPLKNILCTDISRDGTLEGPNVELYKECITRYPQLLFQASGGVSSLQDLEDLARIPVSGAIVGKALYENQFSLVEAFAALQSIEEAQC